MKERLLRAYFTEGELMGDHETLDPARGRGWPRSRRDASDARERSLRRRGPRRRTDGVQFGISAVPTFVIDRTIGASGAHPPEALLQLLNEGWARRAPGAGDRRRRGLRRRRLLAPAHSGDVGDGYVAHRLSRGHGRAVRGRGRDWRRADQDPLELGPLDLQALRAVRRIHPGRRFALRCRSVRCWH